MPSFPHQTKEKGSSERWEGKRAIACNVPVVQSHNQFIPLGFQVIPLYFLLNPLSKAAYREILTH